MKLRRGGHIKQKTDKREQHADDEMQQYKTLGELFAYESALPECERKTCTDWEVEDDKDTKNDNGLPEE